MKNNKWILEALRMQPLSEEEKASRHILGRLYGPIATCEEATRNGRKYNKELWTKALNDDVFKEKIANKSLFLELGHPANREETDMEKVCACIPEMPKIVNGDLYAIVDILDTPNGKLLKTLCDYGFTPGISSRGTGDVMANNEVDPETFFLETWDIVQLPAVKKARLSMYESLDEQQQGLRRALIESYKAADAKEKKDMKEALDNLSIKLDEAQTLSDDDIPMATFNYDDEDSLLTEDTEDDEVTENDDTGEVSEVEEPEETEIDSEEDTAAVEETNFTAEEANKIAVDTATEVLDSATEDEMPTEDDIAEVADKNVKAAAKLKTNDVELPDTEDDSEVKGEIDKTSEEEVNEVEEKSDEAADSGLDEWLKNFKELIHQKDLLESENKQLKIEKAVSDAKVVEQKEAIDHYTASLDHARKLAARSKEFKEQVNSLSEQLQTANKKLSTAEKTAVKTKRLSEGFEANKQTTDKLTEQLNATKVALSQADDRIANQHKQYKKKLNEAVTIAKNYKAKYEQAVSHYIEARADMLGVRTSDIINKLQENYTLDDVDTVCESMLEEPANFSNALFAGLNNGAKMKIKESIDPTVKKQKAEADDIFDGLLELAGLKK